MFFSVAAHPSLAAAKVFFSRFYSLRCLDPRDVYLELLRAFSTFSDLCRLGLTFGKLPRSLYLLDSFDFFVDIFRLSVNLFSTYLNL
jgi:hypothetical protein